MVYRGHVLPGEVLALPGEYYTSDAIHREEAERIFARRWVCVGRAAAVPEAGDFMRAEVAGESLIVVRGEDGVVRALYSVCRHRGTRLCEEPAGRFPGCGASNTTQACLRHVPGHAPSARPSGWT
jgi:glycine betaine catabolism A